ncbi:MAG TPA: hypothetical protein VK186_20090 [Candidatus Deferrimicrobium sp.]|nr:hypothetical protein [Candidatus Kapabacteria bacterium]HLP61153.1 hypothetical protein [Candidatus Deferrimicrobium sp.]
MNKYDLAQLDDIDDLNEVNRISKVYKASKYKTSNGTGKKVIMILLVILAAAVPVAVYLFSAGNEKVEAEKVDKGLFDNMLNELQMERALVEQEKQRLAEHQRNLKNFESELNKKYSEYAQKAQQLADKEIEFNSKVDLRSVDRQAIETYESIDSEQAAILLRNLYKKDPSLATLIIRKISGKKAGRLLEAMIPIDREAATKIAQDALNYYRPK